MGSGLTREPAGLGRNSKSPIHSRKLAVAKKQPPAPHRLLDPVCWLCSRPIGRRVEYHHPVPKSRGGRSTVPIHPICHRTLHKTFSNAELGVFGESVAMIRADPRIGRFLDWIANKPADFHAPTHGRR